MLQAFAKACDVALEYRGDDPWDVTLDEVRQGVPIVGCRRQSGPLALESDGLRMPTAEEAAVIRVRLGNPLRRRRCRERSKRHTRGCGSIGTSTWARTITRRLRTTWRRVGRTSGWCGRRSLKKTTGKSFTTLIAEEGM